MKLLRIILLAALFAVSICNACINKHCKTEQSQCKEDKSQLPCTNVINTCLDLCPTNTNYSCLSFCLSSRKNQAANNFLKCCTTFECKVEKFTAIFFQKHLTIEQNLVL